MADGMPIAMHKDCGNELRGVCSVSIVRRLTSILNRGVSDHQSYTYRPQQWRMHRKGELGHGASLGPEKRTYFAFRGPSLAGASPQGGQGVD